MAKQPWYMPFFWPLGHVTNAIKLSVSETLEPLEATPDLDFIGHLTSVVASLRSFMLAYLAITATDYPAFGTASHWSFSWMWPIVLRNLLATWVICGFWDWFLYLSPLKEVLRPFKMNPKYPPLGQLRHDAVATTVATLCGSAVEIFMCRCWATGQLAMQPSLQEAPLWTLFWAATIVHWRIPHFYLMHRALHPWRTTRIPDFGKILYRHVHAQHHKSYLPTAFSGTNMHPVEATLYYLMPSLFMASVLRLHPAIPLGCIIDCAVGAWLGHDGFRWPGAGDYFHQLHHENFDCNYGAQHVPIDKWFGTYCGSKADLKKVWGQQGALAGRDANLQDTKVWDCK